MLIRVICIILILVSVGCGHSVPMIRMVPTQTHISSNVETGIKVWATYNHYYEKSKESIRSVSLETDELQILPENNLEDVVLNLYIVNPRRVKYSLYKTINFKEDNLIEMSDYIYKGNEAENIFQLHFPKTTNVDIVAGANLYVADTLLMLIEKMTYRIHNNEK